MWQNQKPVPPPATSTNARVRDGQDLGPRLSKQLRNDRPRQIKERQRCSMTGNNGKGIVVQERDRHLFRVLAILGVIDREQAKQIARFGSTTRANVRLLALTRAGLLRRFYLGTERGGK